MTGLNSCLSLLLATLFGLFSKSAKKAPASHWVAATLTATSRCQNSNTSWMKFCLPDRLSKARPSSWATSTWTSVGTWARTAPRTREREEPKCKFCKTPASSQDCDLSRRRTLASPPSMVANRALDRRRLTRPLPRRITRDSPKSCQRATKPLRGTTSSSASRLNSNLTGMVDYNEAKAGDRDGSSVYLFPLLDSTNMQRLAKEFTQPRRTPKFQLSQQTKTLGNKARVMRSAPLWKEYHRRVRDEHKAWQEQQCQKACSDWRAYRSHHRARKTQATWTASLARHHDEDPLEAVTRHFTRLLQQADAGH